VDFARGVVHVRNTKTDKDRVVPMNKAVREMLERQPKASGYVFPSPKTGGRLIDIKRKFDEARRVAKITDFRFHDLRHTAATRLADAGVNVIVIAEILGHSDIRTTKRYSHVMEEAKREAVEKLAETGAERQKHAKSQGKEKRQAH
jgi:integrase